MQYQDYDPKRHGDDLPLFAIEDRPTADDDESGIIVTIYRPVTDPDERETARLTPWFYVVGVEAEPA